MPFQKLLHFLLSGRKSASQAALDEYFLKEGDEIHMSQQSLRAEFGASGAGATSPTARISIAYDVINDRIVDADISPLSIDERIHAKNHLSSLYAAIVMEDSLFIYDRGYASEDLINYILSYKAQFLMRVSRKFSVAVDEGPWVIAE